jgi:hypothetical protein
MKKVIPIFSKKKTFLRDNNKIRIFSNKKNKNYKNEDAQLLLLAGIFLSVAIITLASITVSLANLDISIDKTSFIKTDYDNIRKEFGVALKDKLGGKLNYKDSEPLILTYFNDTRDIFVFFVESLNGNYFDAEYKGLTFTNDEPDGIICIIKFSNGNEYISEVINYDIY